MARWLAAVWAALLLVAAAGCGSAPQGAGSPESVSAASRDAIQRRDAMAGVFNLLGEVGMTTWADLGRAYLDGGRICPMDFSSPTANKWGVTGLDAAVDPARDFIYVDQTVWLSMPPRHLAIVMLDELAHLYYHTGDHTAFEGLQGGFIQRWATHFGRPFSSLGPEDDAYKAWWDAFLRAHPNG